VIIRRFLWQTEFYLFTTAIVSSSRNDRLERITSMKRSPFTLGIVTLLMLLGVGSSIAVKNMYGHHESGQWMSLWNLPVGLGVLCVTFVAGLVLEAWFRKSDKHLSNLR